MTDEVEIEIGVQVCRCRMPENAAPAARERLQAGGLHVTSSPPSEGKVELVAKHIEVMTVRFAAARVKPGTSWQVAVQDTLMAEGETDAETLHSLRRGVVAVPGNHDDTRPRWLWLPVFDVRAFTRTGTELFVVDDDACRQLDVLAPALGMDRDAVTIRPRPGWCGYGHPALRR